MLYLISYDVADDRRRNQVAKILLGYGSRVQWSVFECELDEQHLVRLQERVLAELSLALDSLRIYRLCGACRRNALIFGAGPPLGPPDVVIV
ncbi:MAG: CRISPR-associated endonuclease Cas2 [Myxococcota bacterium]|jgi:CRISPR-associated protein Cas2|nr:CRISPR-associated endonuclease Cas2 [Myxococcota bacterium]